ncbi:MAG: MFS transporter [Dorea sp.]
MNAQKTRPFGWRDNVGYLSGNIACDLTFTFCSGFLMKFYTDVMGVSAAVIGIMMMLAQVADAVTDIAMGQICDRAKTTPVGKFKPWIRRIAGPIVLCSFLMYAVWFKDMNMGFKIVWMFVTYLLYCSIFYTAIVVPYGSMATAITQDPTERASLANMRHIGGTLAMTAINVILPMIVYYTDANGNKQLSGTKTAIAAAGLSILAFIFYMICYFLTTERVKIPSTNSDGLSGFGKALKNTLGNRAMIGVALVVIIYEIGNQGLHGMSAYLYPNYLQNVAAQSASGVLETIVTLLMTLAVVPLVRKFGKREAASLGIGFAAIMLVVCYFTQTHSAIIWLVFYCLVTAGLGIWGPVQWSLVGDIVDDTEIRTGTRADGGIYGVFSFARKFGQAISSGVRGILLTAIGFTSATAFDPEVTKGIFSITTLFPFVAYVAMVIILMTVYPLSKKRVEENAAILEKRHAESKSTDEN